MNETLSAEEIQQKRNQIERFRRKNGNGVLAGWEFTDVEMEYALNTIEALKESSIQEAALSAKFCAESEAKDAQIKQLVTTIELAVEQGFMHKVGSCGRCSLLEALSTVPDVEGYRLEREVVDESIAVCHKASNGGAFNIHELRRKVQALEAYREKVKNDA